MVTEIELNDFYELKLPKDTLNKIAISIQYYFPSILLNEYEMEPLSWNDKYGYIYETIPITKWGSDNDYKEIMDRMEMLKNLFIDKGILLYSQKLEFYQSIIIMLAQTGNFYIVYFP